MFTRQLSTPGAHWAVMGKEEKRAGGGMERPFRSLFGEPLDVKV